MIPLVALLIKNGLGLAANALLAKGKEYVEQQVGVKLDADMTPESLTKVQQWQLENETELMRLRVEDNRINAEVKKAELDADVAFQNSAQESGRIEVQSTDEYVRRTRPSLARKSFTAGTAYTLLAGVIFPVVN